MLLLPAVSLGVSASQEGKEGGGDAQVALQQLSDVHGEYHQNTTSASYMVRNACKFTP